MSSVHASKPFLFTGSLRRWPTAKIKIPAKGDFAVNNEKLAGIDLLLQFTAVVQNSIHGINILIAFCGNLLQLFRFCFVFCF